MPSRLRREVTKTANNGIKGDGKKQPRLMPSVTGRSAEGHRFDYRLRVGRYRVLFNYADVVKIIEIQEVKKRDERTY